MPVRKVTDEQLHDALQETNSPTALAAQFGISMRAIQTRLRKLGVPPLDNHAQARKPPVYRAKPEGRLDVNITDGSVIIGSDCHYWPGMVSTAHRAFVRTICELRPKVVIMNGDVFDGASASRHPRLGWAEKPPSVRDELRAVEERLAEIKAACPPGCITIWTRGNHCMRFEMMLAANVPQYEGVQGFSLSDHFPEWKHCMAVWLGEKCVVKHRLAGGVHATYNNTLRSGVTLVTGHLHRLQTTTFSDYNGTRWGVDTGTMADPYGPQFAGYTELGPVNWASGFAVLTFADGELLYPELAHVVDEGKFSFRGQVIDLGDQSAMHKAKKA